MRSHRRLSSLAPLPALAGAAALCLAGALAGAQGWPFDVTDLSGRSRIVLLVFGDGGTGEAGQQRVGQAMADVCRRRACDAALMLGDNLYEDGVEVHERDDAARSYAEIASQFERKFERPYRALLERPGLHVWAVAGNHDYEARGAGALHTWSRFSRLWRMPAQHYAVPRLPAWLQIQAIHTDTEVERDLNGLQVAALERDLCADGPERWKLAFGHQPVHNSGHHQGSAQERHTRSLLEPVFRKCGLHVYFSGHAHHQEHLTAPGFEQVIQGAAGKSKGRNRPAAGTGLRQRFFSRTFGFAVVELDRERLRLDFYDVRNTTEKARAWTKATADEIVPTHAWCGERGDVGRPELDASPCPPLGAR